MNPRNPTSRNRSVPGSSRPALPRCGLRIVLGWLCSVLVVSLGAGFASSTWAAEAEPQRDASKREKPAPAEETEGAEAREPGAHPAGARSAGARKPGVGGQARRRAVPELDRVTLKSGRVLEGLILREDNKQLTLKIKLTTKAGRVVGFVSFPILRKEVSAVKRASPEGRALTEAAWKKLEASLRERARAARRRTRNPDVRSVPTPAPEAAPAPSSPEAPSSDPRDILLEEAERLGLKVPPGTSTEQLQQLVEAEQRRRHQQADALLDEAINAFSEAAALLPNLTYRSGSGSSAKTVYREAVLNRMLNGYRRAYRLLQEAVRLDPTTSRNVHEWQEKVLEAVAYLETVARTADLIEGPNGGRRNNPNRRR